MAESTKMLLALFVVFLAFGGYVFLIPLGILVVGTIKLVYENQRHKNQPLAKRRIVKKTCTRK